MTCFSAFGGILFGYDTGVIGGVKEMPDWLKTFGFPTTDVANHPSGYMISSSTESLVVSILSAGTFFGALLGAPVAGMSRLFIVYRTLFQNPHHARPDILGRKFGIVLACLVFSVGVAMQTASTAVPLFVCII